MIEAVRVPVLAEGQVPVAMHDLDTPVGAVGLNLHSEAPIRATPGTGHPSVASWPNLTDRFLRFRLIFSILIGFG